MEGVGFGEIKLSPTGGLEATRIFFNLATNISKILHIFTKHNVY